MAQAPLDHRGFLNDRQEPHLATTVRADERGHFVDPLDQARPDAAGRLAELGIGLDGFKGRFHRCRVGLRRLQFQIHIDWRDGIADGARDLDVEFTAPVTDHAASEDYGVAILGEEPSKFWHDHKGAKLNAIRTRSMLEAADLVVVRFGDKYKQWNAAFDAGYAAALGTPLVLLHGPDHAHALKEVDAAALAVAERSKQGRRNPALRPDRRAARLRNPARVGVAGILAAV